MSIILNLIVFFLIIGVIVTLHEFGHFIAAKFFNVYCGSFSIGMGPKLYEHKGKETKFELRALPIGGFVTMAGEADQEDNEEFKNVPLERTLKGKRTYQKVIIFLAGVFMNFVLALVIMLSLNFAVGRMPVNEARVGSLVKGEAASKAGMKKGDVIINIESPVSNKSSLISSYEDMNAALTKKELGVDGDTANINVTVNRKSESIVINMNVKFDENQNKYVLGITEATRKMNFTESIRNAFSTLGAMSVAIFEALEALVLNFTKTVKQMSGPVGIYQVTAQVTKTGSISNIFYLMALLSVNIGIFNLLPIPGLDGAQTLFAIIEGIIHRELPLNVKYTLQIIGLSLILLLMVVVTYQDITKLLR